jgi:hypothetical protein
LEEVENLEKKRINDALAQDKAELMAGAANNSIIIPIGPGNDAVDPYSTELPDIDVENDMNEMKRRDKEIVKDFKCRMTMLQS